MLVPGIEWAWVAPACGRAPAAICSRASWNALAIWVTSLRNAGKLHLWGRGRPRGSSGPGVADPRGSGVRSDSATPTAKHFRGYCRILHQNPPMTSRRRQRCFRWCPSLGTPFIWCIVSTTGGSCVHGSTAEPPNASTAHAGGNRNVGFGVDKASGDINESGSSAHKVDAASSVASVAERHLLANHALQRGIELQNVRDSRRFVRIYVVIYG